MEADSSSTAQPTAQQVRARWDQHPRRVSAQRLFDPLLSPLGKDRSTFPRTVPSYIPRSPCASLHNGRVFLEPVPEAQPPREIRAWFWLSGSLGKSLCCEHLGLRIHLLPDPACKNKNPVVDFGFLGVVFSFNPLN